MHQPALNTESLKLLSLNKITKQKNYSKGCLFQESQEFISSMGMFLLGCSIDVVPGIQCYKFNNIRPPYTYACLIRWVSWWISIKSCFANLWYYVKGVRSMGWADVVWYYYRCTMNWVENVSVCMTQAHGYLISTSAVYTGVSRQAAYSEWDL